MAKIITVKPAMQNCYTEKSNISYTSNLISIIVILIFMTAAFPYWAKM